MISTIIFDFSRVLLFPKDINYSGGLNSLYREIIKNPDYTFLDHYFLNTELLEYVKTLKGKYKLAIFTNEIIQNDPAIRGEIEAVFNQIISAKDMGVKKSETTAYLKLMKILNVNPEDTLYIDDKAENITAAKSANLQTIIYENNPQVIADIQSRIVIPS